MKNHTADNVQPKNNDGNMTAFRLVVFGLALALTPAGAAWGTCSFCGSGSYGSCPYGRVHKHTDSGAAKCMYCGSSA